MMNMQDLSERAAALHRMRREQERERRRMRDRQRRQSMTLEQREKHLARRRRNYQLRRERIKHQGSDNQSSQTDTALGGEVAQKNLHTLDGQVSELGIQHNAVAPVGFNQVLNNMNAGFLRSKGTESLAYDLAKIQKRLRLNHVKHFARSLKRPLGELTGSNVPIISNLIMKGNIETKCKSLSGLRLNRLKQLARTPNSTSKETSNEHRQSETEAQENLLVEDFQPAVSDLPITQNNSISSEQKTLCSDGNHQ